MAIQQVISNFPPAPNSATDTPIDFNAKADAFVNHQSGVYTPEVNTWADQANTTASEVNTNATSAEASANEATIQADRAEENAGTTFPNPVFPQEEGYILTARELEGNIWEENTSDGDVGSAIDNIFTGVNTFNGQTIFGGVTDFNNVPRFNTYPRTDGISTLDGVTTHDIANMGIEVGSNANGYYTKFPDGTLICRFKSAGSLTGEVNWPFPFPFISIADLIITGNAQTSSTSLFAVVFKIATTASVNFSMYNSADVRVANGVVLMAVGRWK